MLVSRFLRWLAPRGVRREWHCSAQGLLASPITESSRGIKGMGGSVVVPPESPVLASLPFRPGPSSYRPAPLTARTAEQLPSDLVPLTLPQTWDTSSPFAMRAPGPPLALQQRRTRLRSG